MGRWWIGPLAVTLSATGRLEGPLARCFSGYVGDPNPEPRASVALDVSLDGGLVMGLPVAPRLLVDDAGELRDHSEGWELTLRVGREDARGVARLRPWRDSDDLLRLQIEGLVRVVTATVAPLADAALLHGCVLVAPRGDQAVLFIGKSGDGKTTMTRRLPGWRTLGDDCAVVERRGGRFFVAGTPFAGKERLPRSGVSVPLAAVAVLAPRAPLALTTLERGPAFFELTSRALWFAPGWSGTATLWGLLGDLADAVPVVRLASTLDDDVAPHCAALAPAAEVPPCSAA